MACSGPDGESEKTLSVTMHGSFCVEPTERM